LHPETRVGVAGANARWNASDNLSFASSTADATGKDRRSVERANARGEALGDDLAAVTRQEAYERQQMDVKLAARLIGAY
jgi:hypothetical protein